MSAGLGWFTGWSAFALLPVTALLGWLLRRLRRGPLVARLRPHIALGYAILALALAHAAATMGDLNAADATGIRLATAALGALLLQTFVGVSLQAPGAYRRPLRAWHVVIFAGTLLLAGGHVVLSLL